MGVRASSTFYSRHEVRGCAALEQRRTVITNQREKSQRVLSAHKLALQAQTITTIKQNRTAMSPRENTPLPSRDSFNSLESVTHEYEAEVSTDDDDEVKQNYSTSGQRRVGFGSIQIREYARTIGDNPSVRVGVPLALDWQYTEHAVVSIDEYEENRPPFKTMLRMSSITRRNVLLNVWGFSEDDLANADKEIQKIKRRQTQGATSAAVETTARKARKVGRGLRKGILTSLAATSRMMSPGMLMQVS